MPRLMFCIFSVYASVFVTTPSALIVNVVVLVPDALGLYVTITLSATLMSVAAPSTVTEIVEIVLNVI